MSTVDPSKFLVEADDGLPTRDSHPYALYKLKALDEYIKRTSLAMSQKNWRERYFIDLQAGPGKNKISQEIHLGSPILALNATVPFTKYRFNELKSDNFDALQ